MNFSRSQIIIISIVGVIILFFVLVFLGIIPGLNTDGNGGGGSPFTPQQTELKLWGVFDDLNDLQLVINGYTNVNKNIRISYRQFNDVATYEKTLINALATGQAPDIFMFHSSWLPKHYDKVKPVSETQFPLIQLGQLFPTVVEQDFVLNKTIYALPLYIDTLALLYNKDIFDAKAIALMPNTWTEFQSLIPRLKELNQVNQIIKPAAAIGGSEKSINSASDFLSLLMMQFGSQMADKNNRINFGTKGLQALNFYIQFANPASPYYTWNDNLPYSLDSFSQGLTAVIFNYSSQISSIKNKNPYLNLGISAIPQINTNQPVNYANYWGLSVSNQSKNPVEAWNFIIYATTDPQLSEIYLQITHKPPALRVLIEKYKNDPDLGVFVKQALSARSWWQPDSTGVKQSFSNMIESILNGRLSSENALKQAENEINGL